jgi:N6-adenosine-specific RNA methylase IME4
MDTLPARVDGAPPALDLPSIRNALALATEPEEILKVDRTLEAFEIYLRRSGLWKQSWGEALDIREERLRARWLLGRTLDKIERGKGNRFSQTGKLYSNLLSQWNLNKNRAQEAQRIGTLPEDELQAAFDDARERDILLDFESLIDLARPYWYQASRERKHQVIYETATEDAEAFGPFPLIYADPPWKFEIYSPKGLERTPDQHYPTLSDAEIADFKVAGRPVSEIANDDAALLLWCTSSNLARALEIMRAWDFTFKTSAVWVKDRSGTGLVFRNQHELLLYGTRGEMPGPLWQPRSVFTYPRGRHSAKPPEIRKAIERMYRNFDASARLELFARGNIPGWTTYGFEAR